MHFTVKSFALPLNSSAFKSTFQGSVLYMYLDISMIHPLTIMTVGKPTMFIEQPLLCIMAVNLLEDQAADFAYCVLTVTHE